MPKAPNAETVFRSACIPAPPLESDPAMIRTRGIFISHLPSREIARPSDRPPFHLPSHFPELPLIATAGEKCGLQLLQVAFGQTCGETVEQVATPLRQFGKFP